jgi:hypothetical protein
MQTGHAVRVPVTKGSDHTSTPVTASREEPVVAQPHHQLGPGVRRPVHVPAGRCGLAAEAEAGQRRRDDVEGGHIALRWIGERVHHLERLDNRARPAMRQHERTGISTG